MACSGSVELVRGHEPLHRSGTQRARPRLQLESPLQKLATRIRSDDRLGPETGEKRRNLSRLLLVAQELLGRLDQFERPLRVERGHVADEARVHIALKIAIVRGGLQGLVQVFAHALDGAGLPVDKTEEKQRAYAQRACRGVCDGSLRERPSAREIAGLDYRGRPAEGALDELLYVIRRRQPAGGLEQLGGRIVRASQGRSARRSIELGRRPLVGLGGAGGEVVGSLLGIGNHLCKAPVQPPAL